MADLGNLFFSLGLDTRNIDAAWKKAFEKYSKEAKINIQFDSKNFAKEMESQRVLHKKNMDALSIEKKMKMDAIALKEREALMAERIHTQEARTQAVREKAANTIKNTNSVLNTQQRILQNIHTIAASYISLFAAARLIKNLVTVSGEFEMQRVSLQAILKDLEGANKIFDQIKKLAVQSPFRFKDLISYTKQLSAFSIPMNELYDTTKMLSDVSAGLGVGMDRLVLAYGQIRAASVLRGQEVRQLTEAGIPVIEELRKKFEELGETGITASDVFDKISARLVPFSMIKEMFTDMTSEGGKFYKMQEIQAETLKGKISNLRDAYQIMFAEIGEKGDKILKGAVDSIRWLITNYEQVGKIILELVAIYGTYKAALIAITTYQSLAALQAKFNAINNTQLSITQIALAKTSHALTAAQLSLNAAMSANVYALVAAAVAALGYGIYKLATYQDEAAKAQERLNDKYKDYEKSLGKDITQLDMLFGALNAAKKGTEQYEKAREAIEKQYEPYLKKMREEHGGVLNLVEAYGLLKQKLIEVARERGYEKAIQGALDAYSEGIAKQAEKLSKKIEKSALSGLQKETLKSSLMEVLWGRMEYKDIESGTKKLFETFTEEVGSEKEGTKYVKNTLQPILDKANEITAAFQETKKSAERLFKSEGGIIGAVLDPSKILGSSKKWIQDINDFLERTNMLNKGYEKRTEESPEEYIDRLRGEYKDVTAMISSRSKLAGEDVSGLKERLSTLSGVFRAAGISPYTDEELARQNKKAEKEANMEEKASDKLKDLVIKLQLELSKATVDSMEEGWRKEYAEQAYIHERRKIQIEDYKKELLELQEKTGGSGTTLTPEHASLIGGLTAEEEKAYQNRQKESYNKLLDTYADFERKKNNLDKWYANEKEKLQKHDTQAGNEEIQRSLKVLTDNYHKQMEELMDDELNLIMKTSPLLVRIFSDTANLSRKTLKGIMADAKQLLKYISGDKNVTLPKGIKPEDVEKMVGDYKAINKVQKTIQEIDEEMAKKRAYPLAGFANAYDYLTKARDAIKSIKEDMSEEEKKVIEAEAEAFKTQAVKNFGSAVSETGDMVLYVADSMDKLAEATNNAKLAETAEEIKSVGNIMSAAGKGAQEGGWIGAIIGAAKSIITQTIDAFVVAKAEQYEFEQNQIDFLNQYQNLLLSIKKEDYETVFGIRYLSMASDAAKNAVKAIREYNDLINKRTAPGKDTEVWSKGLLAFTSTQGLANFFKVTTAESKTAMEAYKKGYTDIQRMAIKVIDRSGWANFLGKKDKYKTLFDIAPEIWGGSISGDFNTEAAKAFLDTNTKITDEQRKQIENLIKQKELYDENINIIREDIKDTFGDFGDAMTDAIVQSTMTSIDAFSLLEDAGAKAMENIGKKLIYDLFFADKLKKFQAAIEATYTSGTNLTPEDIAKEQRTLLQDFFSTIGSDMENAREWAERWKQESQAAGFNIWQNSSDSSFASGIQGIQEKTANLLASYINSIRADVAANKADVKNLVPIIGNINDIIGNGLAELQMINSNTFRSAKGTEAILDKLNSLTVSNGATKLNVRAYVN